jgi:hypothetical protein
MGSRLALTLLCPLILLFASLLGVPQASAAHSAHAEHRTSKRTGDIHGRKSHAHHVSKHKRPRVKHRKAAHTPASATGHGSGEQGATVAATCQNGVRPVATEEGSFACTDGSEPTCPKELVATVSDDGSTLLCEAEPSEEGEGEEGGEDPGAGELEYDSSD